MSVVRLGGAVLDAIEVLFMTSDGFSLGEKLTQIEKTAGKRYYDMSDEDLYNALQLTINTDYYSDEFDAK